MKKTIYLICFITIKVFSQESDTSILEKTISNIYDIERVKYQSTFQAMDGGTTYLDKIDTVFFDFTNSNNSTPKYHMASDESELIYDGKRHISTLVNEKVILIDDTPNANNPLILTLYGVKKFLPEMMMNENIEFVRKQDTLLNGQKLYVFDITFKGGYIDWGNFVLKNVSAAETEYTLMIGMSDYLPRKMIMDNGPTGRMSRTYDSFDFDYNQDDSVWSGALFPKDYSKMTWAEYREKQKNKMQSLKVRSAESKIVQDVEHWKLPNLENNSIVDFNKLKGNVILIEFWFKNCGPCVQAVPKLNAIHEKYKDSKFQLFGIEYREDFPQENLMAYVEKIKIEYPTLYKGKSLAATYEVTAAPTFILINKKGDVIFAESGFNEKEIIKLIEANL
ncbi:TlpA family protein disulfide reductase [Arenibacter sp. TNZ]|uniref:TlpA family protein disulfide reductase n=1 Tax=Arenibacter TaxID=178469 RepID=UPI000CD4788E|nr:MULTISPECIES: TlpA disulfide reductase family protein [Arenibacter]MCM4174237.1 TlpA family protein disulfide reductase [Arenibacter sp. TNZ]